MPISILIVEDDLTFSLMLKTWLGKKGFQVNTVSNISRARRELTDNPYDVILSDLRLPDEDGIALLNWMHKHGITSPLIIMTGYADIQSAVQAMKCGANDYISKPVQPDELLKKIREALQTGKDDDATSTPIQEETAKGTDTSIYTNPPHLSPTNSITTFGWWLPPKCQCSSTEPAGPAKNT